MRYIAHRINTIKELKKVPEEYGVEVDLRDCGGRLILQHEPFVDGENLKDYLKYYNHGTMILNVKSERIEFQVLELLKKYKVTDYFFLDSSFGMIYSLTKQGEKNMALRFSEFEGLDTILAMKGRLKWVWVDCFTKLSIDKNSFEILKKAGFMLCLTSPELLGRPQDISRYKRFLLKQGILFDAICTKIYCIDKWRE